uniref:Uncharacterized protein n=1 Tax=Chlorobium chlorochromatii (strain CaD3) TaxID=340177 RepID=Q3ATJ7_CHLCH
MKKAAFLVALAALFGGTQANATDWNWKGDVRYRYQSDLASDPAVTGENSRDRHRTRVRLGVYPWISEELTGGLQFSTAGAGDETTSRNETFGDQFVPDQLYLNEAFINFHPKAFDSKVNIILGKREVANTMVVLSDLVWDGDLTFEGMTLQYGKDENGKNKDGWNAMLGYYPLNEINDLKEVKAQDAYLLAGQVAYKGKTSAVTYHMGAGYYDYTHFDVSNKKVNASQLAAAPYTYTAAKSATYSPEYDYTGKDFNIIELFGTVGGKLTENTPWTLTLQYAFNTAKQDAKHINIDDDERTSYLAGVKIGDAKNVGQWAVGADYVRIEKDAMTVLTDSDRNGGTATNLEGMKLGVTYHMVKNMTVGATYFNFNTIDNDATAVDESATKRHTLMLDTVVKF